MLNATTVKSLLLFYSLLTLEIYGRHEAFVSVKVHVPSWQIQMSSEPSLMDCMSHVCSQSLGRTIQLKPTSGGNGAAGGGGATVRTVLDTLSGTKYFVKSAPMAQQGAATMLRAEYIGVQEMANTRTIKVPTPIAFGSGGPQNTAFLILEYIDLSLVGESSAYEMGQQLAQMHGTSIASNQNVPRFGFHVDNTIGATPQPNPWTDNWADFWENHRLGYMLDLLDNLGYSVKDIALLKTITRQCLSHNPPPSLIHGDLWSGNKGYCRINGNSVPVIFDPATYYGDREADIAMTELFGGFGTDFYKGYESEWPLDTGYDKRKIIYNLYHIMNHGVLFGGGYQSQARNMIEEIMRFKVE